ncbi:MAG: class I SAM-dependent methyltransferase [Rudaea sp.]
MDLFAAALCRLYNTGRTVLIVERDDGFKDTEDLSWYLTSFRSFPTYEKQALKLARGRVLDVGCGAGRHALYLQRRGLRVTGIDNARCLVELARRRGVRDARLANACSRLPFADGEFDTVLLFGNNLGMCGSPFKFRRMLRELHRVTSPEGRILATTRMPSTTDPVSREYLARNIEKGRPIGNMRLRLSFEGEQGGWFDLLLFSPTDLMQATAKEGWRLEAVYTEIDLEDGYSAVLQKRTV